MPTMYTVTTMKPLIIDCGQLYLTTPCLLAKCYHIHVYGEVDAKKKQEDRRRNQDKQMKEEKETRKPICQSQMVSLNCV